VRSGSTAVLTYNPAVNACTIVSRRELARARVLADTLREHHPDSELTVLLLDGDPQTIGEIESTRLVGLEDVVGADAGVVAIANPPGALALAALPLLVRRLLDAGAESVVYLGSGQRVLGALDELEALLASRSLVLVARVGAERSDPLAAFVGEGTRGVYSRELLGFRAGRSTMELLSAWPRCFVDAGDDGADAVRSWLDGVPALSEAIGVLRDPGYGLDLWALTHRVIAGGAGEALQVDGRPARVFDFSVLDPRDPPSLFDGENCVRLSSSVALAELTARHAGDLLAAGFEQDDERPLPYAQLQDGLRLTPTIRALVAQAIAENAVTRSPFTEAGRTELYGYLNQPCDRGRSLGLTRLHLAIWEARADLQSAYPHIDGPDGAGLAGWLGLHGAEQEGLVPALLPPTPELAYRDANPHIHEDPPRWGVNVAGFFTAELGVGEAARLLIAGLDAASIPALPIQGRLVPPSRQGEEFAYARIDEAAYSINIVCINGDGIPVFAREAGRSFFEGRHTIALWWWEVGDPPAEWNEAYEFVDEVWVASQHIYDAIAPTSPVPVVRMTLPVLVPRVAPRTRTELGLPEDGFLFLYMHDYHSVAARKNPTGLIESFRRAFPPGSGAKLVLKSINAATRPDEHDRIKLAAGGHPDITLIDGYASGAEKNAMIAHCDCYVSLHRSEGFGLTVAEAMLLSKPVIATRYGGTQEFLTEENAYLIDWEPVVVGEGAFPYPANGVWAEPDLDQAAELMRHVLAERDEAHGRGQIARHDMLERHSPTAAGEAMRRRLALIHERLYQGGARSLNLAHLPSLSDGEVAGRINSPPAIGWGSGRLARLRKRVLRPVANWSQAYIEHQSQVEAEAHDAIARVENVSARIDSRLREVAQTLQDQQQAQHAETLAVLRNVMNSGRPGEKARPK
jgi:glycosyltransferase involved in cell wall biosynthesis